jgi:Zn-dependent protease with chaperone function
MVEAVAKAEPTADEAMVAVPAVPSADPGAADLDLAYALAQRGYALVPAIAGLLIATPAVTVAWTLLVRHQSLNPAHSWLLLFLVPAMLLILASWVRFEQPDGQPVSAADAPELFALIEKVRSYLKAPAIDAVYLTDTFAAKAVQRPSRGLFGGFRNEIVIGLPLLQSVSKAEAAVLLAHELGHLSGRAGDKAAVVHRARQTWQHIMERQPRQPQVLRLVFSPLVKWFAPGFLAQSAAAERATEFAADRYAAEIAGAPTVASALQRLSIAEAFLGEYWSRVAEEPITTPEPTLQPHREMANFLPRMTEWELAEDVLDAELVKPGQQARPSLAERLTALGVEASLPGPVSVSAESLLGPSLNRVLTVFDASWRAANAPHWRATYDKLAPETRRLLDLDALAAAQPLDLAPAIERAKLAYFADGMETAGPRYQDLLTWHAADGRAHLAAGMAMLDAGADEALDQLRHALALAPRTDWTRAHAEDWFGAGEALLDAREDFGIDCLEQSLKIDSARTDLASFMVDRYLDPVPGAATAA